MIETITVPITSREDYAERLQIAVAKRPRWAESLVIRGGAYNLWITYSDDPKYGGTIAENIAYLVRHGLQAQ